MSYLKQRAINTPGIKRSPTPRNDTYYPLWKIIFIGRSITSATSTITLVLKTQKISYKKVPQSNINPIEKLGI